VCSEPGLLVEEAAKHCVTRHGTDNMPDQPALIAVDIGNNRLKFGRFDPAPTAALPEPTAVWHTTGDSLEPIVSALAAVPAGRLAWRIGSVNRPSTTRLLDWLGRERPGDGVTLLAARDLPLKVELERPDMVGIDRLLDAVAANRLRSAGRPAVVIDVGSAITVDLVSAEGAFLGGAILPGIAMSARALHTFTDLLPLVEMSELLEPPPSRGTATVPAMKSGLFWGAVGSIRELIARLSAEASGAPAVFLTGGAGPAVASLLGPAARHVPHLTLAGIALAQPAVA